MSCLLTACRHERWESMWSNTNFDFEEDAQYPFFFIRRVGFGVLLYSVSWFPSVLRSWLCLLLQIVFKYTDKISYLPQRENL
jgi:hypothetical protein